MTDPKHCGRCGKVCHAPANGIPTCSKGRCSFYCQPRIMKCGNKCKNVVTDPASCGSCNMRCPNPVNQDGFVICELGSCGFQCSTAKCCSAGFFDCDGPTTYGCGTQQTVTDCYGCGKGCPLRPNTKAARCLCASEDLCDSEENSCGYTECVAGFADRDGDFTNGCETCIDGC